MEPEEAAPGDAFVTKGRVRLAEAVRHLVDATLTAEDASSERLASAAEEVERHVGPGDAILVKGSRAVGLELVADEIIARHGEGTA